MARAALGMLALLLACASPLAQQAYPDRPLRIVVPYAAGGGVDNITRLVVQHLAPRLEQPIVVENRPGANGNIGADAVVRAAPDGYTLLMGATFLAFNRATSKKLPYDAATDLRPVARAGRAPFILAVPASAAWTTVDELVAYLKAHPDEASYGAVGAGSLINLLFVRNTGTRPVQVLYKGGAAAMPDLIAGRLSYMIQTVSEILPLVRAGKLRALAVTGTARMHALPQVPTLREAGVAGLEGIGWWGLFAPAATPAPVIERLSSEMQALMQLPEVLEALERMGIEPAPLPAAEFSRFYRHELDGYASVAREFNLSVD